VRDIIVIYTQAMDCVGWATKKSNTPITADAQHHMDPLDT